ncbi:MAG: LL-diaminopimelate aminotransferase [Verrucomicrobiales bacterium]
MANVNEHFRKLRAGYLFPEIARRVNAFTYAHPGTGKRIIRCGIGDVTEPLPLAAREAMHKAVEELGHRETFRGYGPEQGYPFLREAIARNLYRERDIEVADDEIFISDGSKCDTGNILDIFGPGNRIGIPDPVYPVYVDTNVMAGNTGEPRADGSYEGLQYLPCTEENGFMPTVPDEPLDLIYFCSPNNPTGAAATRPQLEAWVAYAREHDALILFDAAYEAFISDDKVPHSIYEIPQARECAIEFRSFSKQGGFTGVRCAFTVIPKELTGRAGNGERLPLHALWSRRMSTKFNGVSYIVQRAAEALFSQAGQEEVDLLIQHYMGNAHLLREAARAAGLATFGGTNAPYLWVRTPNRMGSWELFDLMLERLNVVVTPGAGFGANGEGYFRISAFNSRHNVEEVCHRLRDGLAASIDPVIRL